MYHYIFFDLDGTLTDSKEGILNSLRYAFDKLGEPVPPESTLIKFIGPPLQDSFAGFCGFSAERAAEAIAAFRERYEPIGKFENMAAPGMADLCARLKARGYVLALASSKPESLCVPICERFGFTPSLAVVTGSPPVGDWTKADVIRENLEVYQKDSRLSGAFIWQFADCRVTEEGGWFATRARSHNNKGVLDEYRRPKLAYDTVKEFFENWD